jgi:signal transduction histidine kinase
MADKPFEATYRIHRRTLIRFVLFLLALLVLADVTVIMRNHESDLRLAQHEIDEKLSLAGDFCVEAILKSDYVSVEQFLLAWTNKHPKILQLRATTPNDFAIVDFHRNHDARHTLSATHQATFQNQNILTIEIVEDLTALYSTQWLNALSLIGLSAMIVSAFGLLLWNTLRRTAFLPLQHEISERQKAEQELIERGHELETSNKELETFCYSVSHDLRAPLRGIHGFSTVLAEDFKDQLDDTGRDYLQRICNGTIKMSLLIDVLLDLSRVNREELSVKSVNLSEIASEILSSLQQQEPQRKAKITVQENLWVDGDPNLLRILLTNLLGNAWKYSRQKPETIITFTKTLSDTGSDVFCVSDNGAGFDMEYSDKLFSAFQRLHRQDEFEGTGVGLATVKRIISRHRGEVWAKSKPGEGAQFYFSLWQQRPAESNKNSLDN